jgi:hypothetical protein
MPVSMPRCFFFVSSHDKTPKAPALGYYALGLGARGRRKGNKRDPNYTP